MDVVHCLSAFLAGVDHGAIALCQSLGSGNLGGCPMKVADQGAVLLASMGNGRDVLARNDEDVYGRLRINVGKGVALVVLVDGFGRDTSIDNPAEEAAHFGFSLHDWGRRATDGHMKRSRMRNRKCLRPSELSPIPRIGADLFWPMKGRDASGYAGCAVSNFRNDSPPLLRVP